MEASARNAEGVTQDRRGMQGRRGRKWARQTLSWAARVRRADITAQTPAPRSCPLHRSDGMRSRIQSQKRPQTYLSRNQMQREMQDQVSVAQRA